MCLYSDQGWEWEFKVISFTNCWEWPQSQAWPYQLMVNDRTVRSNRIVGNMLCSSPLWVKEKWLQMIHIILLIYSSRKHPLFHVMLGHIVSLSVHIIQQNGLTDRTTCWFNTKLLNLLMIDIHFKVFSTTVQQRSVPVHNNNRCYRKLSWSQVKTRYICGRFQISLHIYKMKDANILLLPCSE